MPAAVKPHSAAAKSGSATMGGQSAKSRGKQPARGSSKHQAIDVVSSDDQEAGIEQDDEEDDFEEVAVPSASALPGHISSAPGTPASAGPSRAATTTAPTTPADTAESGVEGYEGYDVDESDEEDDGVIRVEIGGETPEEKAKRVALALRKKPMTSKDRAQRLEAHKMHLIALIANARIRNKWANDMLLKCRLLSLLPHPLVTAFSIPPSRFPDRAQRSRLFFEALQSLVTWWSQSFFDIPEPNVGIRTRPWDEVQEVVDKLAPLTRADLLPQPLFHHKGKARAGESSKEEEKEMDEKLQQYESGAHGERLRSINSLMKRAVLQNGSRDVSAILFVSLARACGLGTRLVVNLQAVPWRAEKVQPKKMSGETKGGRTVASRQGNGDDEDEDDDSMEEVEIPDPSAQEGGPSAVMHKIARKKEKATIRMAGKRRHQDPADVYRLKKPKPPPQTAGGVIKKTKPKLDMANQPPVMWAEVFSRADQRWIPVDPMRGTIRKKTHFEPGSDNGPVRMAYVLAFEEDGFAREVTLRYTKSFGAKTSKLRVPTKKDEPDWWEGVLGLLARPYRLNRDDLEDAELETSQVSEAMPLHLSGFKDHPIFVLERHLKREEVIQPKKEVGKFRGESVYRRANVHTCKTAENWIRVGRKVKAYPKQDPMKWVKQRAMTLNRKREIELAKQNGEDSLQGLYAEWQTEVWVPPPIRNGIIPQNAFGNIDLYTPTMLPRGAAHLPCKLCLHNLTNPDVQGHLLMRSDKGIAKVAKSLGISYAEACTGFEFKKQRAIPVITGIVVAEDQVEATMAAFQESAAAAEERERKKREEKALKRWAKLINGLRVRERLREAYGGKDDHNPLNDPSEPKQRKINTANVLANAQKEAGRQWADQQREESPDEEDEMEEVKLEPGTGPADPALGARIGHNASTGEANGDDDDDDMEEVDMPQQRIRTRDFAAGKVKAEQVAEGGDEDADDESTDAEMDALDAAAPIDAHPLLESRRSSPISPNEKSNPNGRSRRPRKAPPTRSEAVSEERPERIQPRRAARNAVKAVDNPYEESSEDEEKAYLDVEDEDEDGSAAGPAESAEADAFDNVGSQGASPDIEPSEAPQKTPKSIKLRIGGSNSRTATSVAEMTGGNSRVTRSSKRKR